MKRRRRVLGNLFHKSMREKSTARFHSVRCIEIHRILLAVVQNQKAVAVHHEVVAIDNPGDLAVDHGLDRKRSREILDDVARAPGVKYQIIGTELSSIRKQVLRRPVSATSLEGSHGPPTYYRPGQ